MQFVQSSKNINTTAAVATAGTALADNPARVYFQVQNVGASPLYVLFGNGAASASNCHVILKAGQAALDGNGGIYESGTVCYSGRVAIGGTAPSALVTEIAP